MWIIEGQKSEEIFKEMIIARGVFYEGRVQGVGFRFLVKQLACGFEVVGWVRNLADGRVEMQCSGEREEVEGLLEAVRESELESHIKSVIVEEIPLLEGVKRFEIIS